MRTLLCSALLMTAALVPSAAQADPFDGSEYAGSGCAAVLSPRVGSAYAGALAAGPYVVADLLQNNGGVVDVESSPGPATEVRISCTIRTVDGYPVTSAVSAAGTGTVFLAPVPVAFDWPDADFEVCTGLSWKDTHGAVQTAFFPCTTVLIG